MCSSDLLLDTGNPVSRASFEVSHRDFIRRICELRDEIRTNEKLAERIRYKYSIKNVTGLNLLPFVRFDDPFEIIAHLMVGSEGTLAFLSEVTMKTEYDYPYKASAMLHFKAQRGEFFVQQFHVGLVDRKVAGHLLAAADRPLDDAGRAVVEIGRAHV